MHLFRAKAEDDVQSLSGKMVPLKHLGQRTISFKVFLPPDGFWVKVSKGSWAATDRASEAHPWLWLPREPRHLWKQRSGCWAGRCFWKMSLYVEYLHQFVNIGYVITVLADSIFLFISFMTTVNCNSQTKMMLCSLHWVGLISCCQKGGRCLKAGVLSHSVGPF